VRVLFAIIALALLGACQNPGAMSAAPGPTTSGPAAESDANDAVYFKAEADAAAQELAERLVEVCVGPSSQLRDFDRCARRKMAVAFDDSGEGDRGCAHHVDSGDYMQCLVTGNVVLDVLHRIQEQAAVGSDFWSSDQTMKQALTKALISGGVDACQSALATAEQNQCLDNWLYRRLDLPAELIQRCPPHNDRARNVCLGEATVIRYMRSHLARLSSVST